MDPIEKTLPPTVTPVAMRRKTCPVARFGRPHFWATGAFYWPLGARKSTLYVGDEYFICVCGEIREEEDV